MSATIDSARVDRLYQHCVARPGEPGVEVEGVIGKHFMHQGRADEMRAEIGGMLDLLPVAFAKDGGGGMSFLAACDDRNGVQWTGLHMHMDQLFILGTTIGRVKCCLPRQMWSALPGGMPYYMVLP